MVSDGDEGVERQVLLLAALNPGHTGTETDWFQKRFRSSGCPHNW